MSSVLATRTPVPRAPAPATFVPVPNARDRTLAARVDAVERVVRLMCERLEEPHTLDALARHAYSSPFHFNRTFRQVTGAPPGRFLTALRIHEAKRLLLATTMTVTDVCMTVGYSSLGTFSTQFKSLVGVAPRHLRQLVLPRAEQPIGDVLPCCMPTSGNGASVTGTVLSAKAGGVPGYVLLGLFPTAVVQGPPVACTWIDQTWADAPGRFCMEAVPSGTYILLACGFPSTATLFDMMLTGSDATVGIADELVSVSPRRSTGPVYLRLTDRTVLHPPILSALPLMLDHAGERR